MKLGPDAPWSGTGRVSDGLFVIGTNTAQHVTATFKDVTVDFGTYGDDAVFSNQYYRTAGQVQYVCRAGNFVKKG